uniref:Uncharacterized protein n=1 Tax=Trichogramma kaykai TaxID=54128 RepID=A0ABD2X2S5_9HYME
MASNGGAQSTKFASERDAALLDKNNEFALGPSGARGARFAVIYYIARHDRLASGTFRAACHGMFVDLEAKGYKVFWRAFTRVFYFPPPPAPVYALARTKSENYYLSNYSASGATAYITSGRRDSVYGAAAASKAYVDALTKIGRQAQLGTWGGSQDVALYKNEFDIRSRVVIRTLRVFKTNDSSALSVVLLIGPTWAFQVYFRVRSSSESLTTRRRRIRNIEKY